MGAAVAGIPVLNNLQKIGETITRMTPEFARPLVENTFGADTRNTQAAFKSITSGNIGGAVKPYVGRAKELAGQSGLVKGPEAPANIAAPEDPAAVADAAKKEKARAKRQAEIDILTDRPGRGGTILTDQYTYKV